MADLAELPLWEQIFMKAYPYRRARWEAPAPVKPLSKTKVALITTAGLHLPEQTPFDPTVKGGDCSYRWLPNSLAVEDLEIAHRSKSWDREGISKDRNLCFPIDRFRELVSEGVIGALNSRHLSFMGSITAPGRLLSETAPEAAQELHRDGVDVAFLTPV